MMTDEERRAALLALAEELGNIHEACRRMAVSRAQYYRWRARREAGLGLSARKPGPPPGTSKVGLEVERAIVAASLAHPAHSCLQLKALLGLDISAVTVQRVLRSVGRGRLEQRVPGARTAVRSGFELPGEPGLLQDAVRLGHLPGRGDVFALVVVEPRSGRAKICIASAPGLPRLEHMIAVLQAALEAFPDTTAVVTDRGKEYGGARGAAYVAALDDAGLGRLAIAGRTLREQPAMVAARSRFSAWLKARGDDWQSLVDAGSWDL
jgi:transposase-like protein